MENIKSLAVANWFLEKAWRNNHNITAMSLQKLVYFAHCWQLALYNEPLTNEFPQAWSWGPVFRDIYMMLLRSMVVDRFMNMFHQPIFIPRICEYLFWKKYGTFIIITPRFSSQDFHETKEVHGI